MITNINKFINEELSVRDAMKPKETIDLLNIKTIDASEITYLFDEGIDPYDPKYFNMDRIKEDIKDMSLDEIEEQFSDGYGAEVYHYFSDKGVDLFETKYWYMELVVNDLEAVNNSVSESVKSKMVGKSVDDFKEDLDIIIEQIITETGVDKYFDSIDEAKVYVSDEYSVEILDLLEDNSPVEEVIEEISNYIENNSKI